MMWFSVGEVSSCALRYIRICCFDRYSQVLLAKQVSSKKTMTQRVSASIYVYIKRKVGSNYRIRASTLSKLKEVPAYLWHVKRLTSGSWSSPNGCQKSVA